MSNDIRSTNPPSLILFSGKFQWVKVRGLSPRDFRDDVKSRERNRRVTNISNIELKEKILWHCIHLTQQIGNSYKDLISVRYREHYGFYNWRTPSQIELTIIQFYMELISDLIKFISIQYKDIYHHLIKRKCLFFLFFFSLN